MRVLLVALVASSWLLIQASGSALPSGALPRLPRDLSSGSRQWSWRVQNQDQDHITYVRTPATGSVSSTRPSATTTTSELTLSIPETDCNKTTTPAPTPIRATRRPASSTSADGAIRGTVGGRRGQPELRSRNTDNSARGRGVNVTSVSAGSTVQSHASGAHPHEGNYFWMVSHRSDDHITYRRRSNDSETQVGDDRAQQGQLRQLGRGSDAVSARVVDSNSDADISTEEDLLNRASSRKNKTKKHHGSHLTHDLVHPYATRNLTTSTNSSRSSLRTRSGSESSRISSQSQRSQVNTNPATGRVNIIFQKNRQATNEEASLNKIDDSEADTSYPNVGDEVDGWRVVSKNKEHISWERVVPTLAVTGTGTQSASHLVRSLDSNPISRHSSSSGSSRRWESGRSRSGSSSAQNRRLKASHTTQSVGEGFPVVFETYSKATFENEDVNLVGTIRTTLTNTSNWNVGDELSGWKVISKDEAGITWIKVKSDDELQTRRGLQLKSGGSLSDTDYSDENALNEEDLLAGIKSNRAGEDDNTRGPPGTWYLAKETNNHITWQRDNVPADVNFDMNDYPRVGDTQSQWTVTNKSRHHISWRRTGTTSSSEEDILA